MRWKGILWRRGWLVNSLRYRVEKDIRETLYQNEAFLRNRWSPFKRLVLWGSKRFILANLLLLIAVCLLCYGVTTNYSLLKPISPSLHDLPSVVAFRSIIFVAQITLLGLVFPLAIAFVSVLLQGKSYNEFMWTIYRHDSGLMLVGFSSLLLSLSVVLLKLLEPWFTHETTVASSISALGWFIINLFLFGWFLWRTVDFLSLDSRMAMFVKYAINEVAPRDIRKKLLRHHCSSADTTDLLLKPKGDNVAIHTFSIEPLRMLPEKIIRKHATPKVISNVWYRLLNFGIRLWIWQTKLDKTPAQTSSLSLPYDPSAAQKEIVLAEANSKINCIAALVIRLSVRTSSKPTPSSLGIKEMTRALFGQIEDSLKEDNSRLFNSAKDNLVQFHEGIESSISFTNIHGEHGNWLSLRDDNYLGENFLDVFVQESTNITREAIRRIRADANYYESWCYLYTRLVLSSTQQPNIPAGVADAYLRGHCWIWDELMSWMGDLEPDDLTTRQQDKAIKIFVGSWEYWKNILNKVQSVDESIFLCASRHLERTSGLLVHATKYGNDEATKWASNMLVNWYRLSFRGRHLGHNYYNWLHEIITPQILRLPEDDPLLNAISSNDKLHDSEATLIALRNYWMDIRCLTAAYLLETAEHRTNHNYKEFIDDLLSFTHSEPTRTRSTDADLVPICNAKDAIAIYIRQNGGWNNNEQNNYGSSLNRHLRELARIEESEHVPSRVYISSVKGRDSYLLPFFQIVGIDLTDDKFTMDQRWLDFFKSDAVSCAQLTSTITKLENLISIDDTTICRAAEYLGITVAKCQQKSALFIDAVEGIIATLKSEIDSRIINAPIDRKKLREFGIVASYETFTASGPMPLPLFRNIKYVDNLEFALDTVKIRYEKSQVSQDTKIYPVIGEGASLKHRVSQKAIIASFGQILKCPWEETTFEDAKSIILRAVNDGQSMKSNGFSPILFTGLGDVNRLINYSIYQTGKEDERLPLDVSVISGRKSTGYICHIADTAVYRFPIPFRHLDFSILLPQETFKTIKVKDFGNGRYVDATFKTEKETDLTGVLSLKFGIECEFEATKCLKYTLLKPESDKE